LSVRRAEAARDFIGLQGIALERLSIRGEGGRRPATSNGTREGRLMNRRIEVILR
jgi:OOP family OmpA-OmpF porin